MNKTVLIIIVLILFTLLSVIIGKYVFNFINEPVSEEDQKEAALYDQYINTLHDLELTIRESRPDSSVIKNANHILSTIRLGVDKEEFDSQKFIKAHIELLHFMEEELHKGIEINKSNESLAIQFQKLSGKLDAISNLTYKDSINQRIDLTLKVLDKELFRDTTSTIFFEKFYLDINQAIEERLYSRWND